MYLPLVSLQETSPGVSGDRLLDVLHRLVAALQVTRGYTKVSTAMAHRVAGYTVGIVLMIVEDVTTSDICKNASFSD